LQALAAFPPEFFFAPAELLQLNASKANAPTGMYHLTIDLNSSPHNEKPFLLIGFLALII
jgi:hypothetical protein